MFRPRAAAAAIAVTLLASPLLLAGPMGAPPRAVEPAAATLRFVAPTPAEAADMVFMREEEKLARDIYLRMHEQYELALFANIAAAEQNHSDAMLRLLTRYRLPDPSAGNLAGEFTNAELQSLYDVLLAAGSRDVASALRVGGLIEEVDIADGIAAIGNATRSDIDAVYDSLMCGSRNHLRGFAATIEALTGQRYVAQALPQESVDAILAAPMERCGR
jgi:hypothetical protein